MCDGIARKGAEVSREPFPNGLSFVDYLDEQKGAHAQGPHPQGPVLSVVVVST